MRRGTFSILREAAALSCIALAVIWLNWAPVLEAGAYLPAHGGDLAGLIYPYFRFAAAALRSGEIPFWNPYSQIGAPFVADIQSAVLYPVNAVILLLTGAPGYRVLTGLVLFHFWLAGALTYWAARRLGLPRGAALVSGVAFSLSDYFVIHTGNLNTIAVGAWIPGILLASLRILQGGPSVWIGLGGICLAMAALAGHIQPLLFGLIAVAVVLVAGLAGGRFGWRVSSGSCLRLLGMVTLGLAAAAPQLVPAAELTRYTDRAQFSYEETLQYAFAPGNLISFLVPDWFGRGPDAYWGQWQRHEGGYVGIATLALAAFAVLATARRVACPNGRALRPVAFTLLVLAAVGILLAIGDSSGIHALAVNLVPAYGALRGAARAIVLTDLALALLAGIGALLLAAPATRASKAIRERFWVSVVRIWVGTAALIPVGAFLLLAYRDNPSLPRVTGVVEGWVMFVLWLGLALGLIAFRRQALLTTRSFPFAVAALLAVDLVSAGQGIEVSRADPRRAFGTSDVIAFLREREDLVRVDTDTGIADRFSPGTGLVRMVPDVRGGLHPLELSYVRRYWIELGSRSNPLYDRLGTTYLVAPRAAPVDQSKFVPVFDGSGDVTVHRNLRAVDRARLEPTALAASDPAEARALLASVRAGTLGAIVVEGGPAIEGQTSATAVIRSAGVNRVVIDVRDLRGAAYLVLADAWYPGWTAVVDGTERPLVRVDTVFRGVLLRPGDAETEFRFEPTGWRWAAVIAVLAWATLAVTMRGWIGSSRRGPGSRSES